MARSGCLPNFDRLPIFIRRSPPPRCARPREIGNLAYIGGAGYAAHPCLQSVRGFLVPRHPRLLLFRRYAPDAHEKRIFSCVSPVDHPLNAGAFPAGDASVAIMRRLLIFIFLLAALPLHAVELGIDVLKSLDFAPLAGKRVGLVTNQTGVDSAGTKTRLLLHKAKNVRLVALFSPEHGIDGTVAASKYIPSRNDSATGLPVFSLYASLAQKTMKKREQEKSKGHTNENETPGY